MPAQNLFFNILTFDWPKKPVTFYYSLTEIPVSHKIHKSCFPNNIETIFPGITINGTEFIYTSYDVKKDKFIPLKTDLSTENEYLVKRYYKGKIKYYFKKVRKQIVKVGFIDDNQVWIKSKFGATELYDVYEKFSIRVQLKTVSNYPELLLTYDGKSKVLKQNLTEAVKLFSQTLFTNVLHDKSVIRYTDYAKEKEPPYEKTYPVINKRIADQLNLESEEVTKENKYCSYLNKLNKFVEHMIWFQNFVDIIPLHARHFLKVPPVAIAQIADESNDLAFHNKQKGRTPKKDFRTLKPFKGSPHQNVHLFFIYHSDDEKIKDTLKEYFVNGLRFYRGLNDYIGLLSHVDDSLEIKFTDKSNPVTEIEKAFESTIYDSDKYKLFAIYLTPFTKEQTLKQSKKIYPKVKELLLKREVVSQSIEPQNVIDAGAEYIWQLTNMSVAILAKLEGIPWKLNKTPENELVVGIGAFRHFAEGVQYLSSAFSFDNTGHFNSFEYFMRNEIDILAGCIQAKVKEFATVNGVPNRLIIHFYKRLSEAELIPIEKALNELELPKPIPVFIITVNKTESKDIVAFDNDWKQLMPQSGTYINIGNKKYLLFNNARHGMDHNAKDGYPFPVKLTIDCNQKEQLQDVKTIHQLINQVYQFSRMYWKSLSQQNLPVTVKYPEMIAEIVPFFDGDGIPPFGKDKLWFL